MQPIIDIASPGGQRGRLSVLVLHRVLSQPDPMYPEAMDIPRFTELCKWANSLFRVLPLDEAVRRLRSGTLPNRALSITFDDGYSDNLHVAMPILRGLGLPATVFVATGFLDGGCMWNDIVVESCRQTKCAQLDVADLLPLACTEPLTLRTPSERRRAVEVLISAVKYLDVDRRLNLVRQLADRLAVPIPSDLMMTSHELRILRRAGMHVGAHTVTHPILAKLDSSDLHQEMQESKSFLESLLEERVPLFAYPNGKPGEDFDGRAVTMARELGFEAAFTTARGAASSATDVFQLPRFTPWDRTSWRFGLRMVLNLLTNATQSVV